MFGRLSCKVRLLTIFNTIGYEQDEVVQKLVPRSRGYLLFFGVLNDPADVRSNVHFCAERAQVFASYF